MTPPTTRETDPDYDLIAWHEIQAEDSMKQAQNQPFLRSPSDMPPCPICQELDDDEDYNM